ncbi:hypothetical protein [Pseudochrobactrum asaccharolyticum]|uniref:hypothetical protein n=1 Tax=Pseudochrobactrum asaccharolyticum TaxID=354351 RepID=UPI0040433B47
MAFFAMFTSLSGANAQSPIWGIDIVPPLKTVIAGERAVFKANVSNAQNTETSATKVNFIIPKNSKLIEINGYQNCTPSLPDPDETLINDFTVSCDVPALAFEQKIDGSITFIPQASGSFFLSGSVDGDVNAKEKKSVTVIEGADVALELDVPATVTSGGDLVFSANITNNGPHTSTHSTLTFPIPNGLNISQPLPASCSIKNRQIKCELKTPLAPGETHKIQFTGKVTVSDGSSISLNATLVGDEPADPDLNNNQDEKTVRVTAGTDVSLSKKRNESEYVRVGDKVTFTLSPNYTGSEPTQAVVIDSLPSSYEFVEAIAGAGWTYDVTDQKVKFTYKKNTASNFKTPLIVKAKVITEGKAVQNTAEISSIDENSGNTANNKAHDSPVHIEEPKLDLAAYKTGPREKIAVVNKEYDFGLSAINEGNVNFSGELTITDHLPEGMEATKIHAPSGWSCSPSPTPAQPIVGKTDIVCVTDNYTKSNPLKINETTT